jgi:hypothetical protein
MNEEVPNVKEKKKSLFAPFASREEALKGVKEYSAAFYVLAGIQGLIGYSVAPALIYDAVILAVLATALRLWQSRVAAILLLAMSTLILGTTVMSRLGIEGMGGSNIFLALIAFWAGVKATEATVKIHGRFAENKDDIVPINSNANRSDD